MTDDTTPTTRAAAAAASVRTTDIRPGRDAVFAPHPAQATGPGEAENDFVEEEFENPDRVNRASVIRWAADAQSPCYSHLLRGDEKTVAAAKEFELTRRELDLLIAANAYHPVGHGDTIAFGIRGAMLRGAEKFENVDQLPMADARPNHVNFRCVMGRYNLKTGKLWAYTASTVPWHEYMASGLTHNLLPTGCYIYKLGTHAPATQSRWVTPALRLSDAKGANSGLVTVLRSTEDRIFENGDKWDQCAPSDNVHCAYSAKSFSSLGCQTIKGGMHDGLWADFQKHLKTLPANARVDYVLVTGAEVAIAASLTKGGATPEKATMLEALGRLRFGSEGDRVDRLQAKLGLAPTGYFGASTKTALTAYQTSKKIASDGIYSTALDAKLGWGVFDDPPAPIPVPPLPAVQPAPQPAPEPAVQPPPAISPAPVVADAPPVPPAPIPPASVPAVPAPAVSMPAATPEVATAAAESATSSSATLAAVAALAATRMAAAAQEPVAAQNTPEAAPGPAPVSPSAPAAIVDAAPASAPSPEPTAQPSPSPLPDASPAPAPASAEAPAPVGQPAPTPPAAPVATSAPDAAPPPVEIPAIVLPSVPPGPPPAVVITGETLHEFAPRARPDYLTVLGGQGNDVLSKFDINKNTLRFCHFMAQVGHECGGFTIVEENLNYSAKRMVEIFGPKIHSAKITAAEAAKLVGNKEAFAERVYGLGNPTKARDLGNTQPGDGYRYRGRGFLQITGRAAYREMGKRIGADLEANPDLAGQPLGALMTAAAFWDSRKLNTYADQDNITIITKRINGGQNGLADRKANYRKAVEIWGDDDDRSVTREGTRSRGPRELRYGDLGPDVLEVKRMLSVLGYDGFVMDEDFSKATHLAVASFQLDRGLDGDGVVDAETRDLLEREAKAAGYVPQTPAGSEHAQWPPRPHTYNVGRGHAVWVWGVILLLCAAALLGLKFFENPRVLQSQSFRDMFDLAVGGTIGLGAIILIALGRRIARSSRRRPHTLPGGGVADDGLRREPGGD